MVQQNVGVKAIRFIIKDVLLDAVKWPVWWYSVGLIDALYRFGDTIRQANDEMALTVWIKNIFVPMYGEYNWQGRLVSFFMRVVQIIFRSIVFVLWVLFGLFVFLVWIFLPLYLVYQVLFNFGLFS